MFLLGSRLRAALPSSLVGLVTFSFVVLGFGAVVYTAALPSLVSASPVVADASKALDSTAEQDGGADVGDEHPTNDASGADDAKQTDEQGSDSVADADQGGAAGLGGLAAPAAIGDGAGDLPDSNGAESDSLQDGDQGPSSSQPEPGNSDSKQDDSGNSDSKKDDQPKSEPSENDAWIHAYIVEKTPELSELQQELTALNQTTSAEFVHGDAKREANRAAAAAFSSKVEQAFGTALNNMNAHVSTRYAAASGDVLSMYRCIYYASETLDQAWTQSIAVAGNAEELTKLYNEAMESEQQYLDEYNSKATALNKDLEA